MSESEGDITARADRAARKARQQAATAASFGAMTVCLPRDLHSDGVRLGQLLECVTAYLCSTWNLGFIQGAKVACIQARILHYIELGHT